MTRPIGPQLKSFLPSAEKLLSSVPFGFSRTTAGWRSESPTSTIFPSGCSAAPNAASLVPPKRILRLPFGPNVASS